MAPQVIEVPRYVGPPAECFAIHALPLPNGSTAQDVGAAQHELILKYEAQMRACRK